MRFRTVYNRLLDEYGKQQWWPADSPFEVMVGAVLTQNTAWLNVEKAINNLKTESALNPNSIISLQDEQLAEYLRPSGYFNIKAGRLKNFCEWYVSEGGFEKLKKYKTLTLRKGLLSVNGVGPETADDILLYAFSRKIFVIDAYTKRIFSRIGVISADIDYESLRELFETKLVKESTRLFNEYHALIVMHGKDVCKTRPLCSHCCLAKGCKKVGL